MKRLLCIVGGMEAGGAETFLMKIYRRLDKTKYQMDFAVAKTEKCFYDDEILSMGGRIFHVVPKTKGILKNFISIKEIVRKNNYQNVLRISQSSISSLELLAARIGGAKKLALRSSNTNSCGSKLNQALHYIFRPISNWIVNIKIAPSTEAGIYMFGKRATKKGKVIYIRNGLEFEKYAFNNENRKKIREKLNIQDKIVVGHIGRYSNQKNHKFLLDIMKELISTSNKYVLLTIGTGPLEEEIKRYAQKLKIENTIIFYGMSDKANEFFSAFDIIVFPSFYEGMPNVIIESQASGLNSVISDTITKEANITGLVKYMSLSDSANKWANTVKKLYSKKRNNTYNEFKNKGYLIQNVVDNFVNVMF